MSVLSVKIWEDSEIAGRRSNWVRSPWGGTICRRMNLATEGRVYEIEVVIEHSLRGEGLQRLYYLINPCASSMTSFVL